MNPSCCSTDPQRDPSWVNHSFYQLGCLETGHYRSSRLDRSWEHNDIVTALSRRNEQEHKHQITAELTGSSLTTYNGMDSPVGLLSNLTQNPEIFNPSLLFNFGTTDSSSNFYNTSEIVAQNPQDSVSTALQDQRGNLFSILNRSPNCQQNNIGEREAAINSGDDPPRIGLNLGVRTYFSPHDTIAGRFMRRSGVNPLFTNIRRCQAEGCKVDLSAAKHYHRRHKVCEQHSKAESVITAGQTQRFCQQCSRFHVLSEFDNGKRSCRKRLADHNRRRRKSHTKSSSTTTAESVASDNQEKNDPSGSKHAGVHATLISSPNADAFPSAIPFSPSIALSLNGERQFSVVSALPISCQSGVYQYLHSVGQTTGTHLSLSKHEAQEVENQNPPGVKENYNGMDFSVPWPKSGTCFIRPEAAGSYTTPAHPVMSSSNATQNSGGSPGNSSGAQLFSSSVRNSMQIQPSTKIPNSEWFLQGEPSSKFGMNIPASFNGPQAISLLKPRISLMDRSELTEQQTTAETLQQQPCLTSNPPNDFQCKNRQQYETKLLELQAGLTPFRSSSLYDSNHTRL